LRRYILGGASVRTEQLGPEDEVCADRDDAEDRDGGHHRETVAGPGRLHET
jgi:hypothetical protein